MTRDGYVRMGDCCWFPEWVEVTEVIGEGVEATVRVELDGNISKVVEVRFRSPYPVAEPITSALIASADVDRLVRHTLQSAWQCDDGVHGPKPGGNVAAG